MKTVSWGLFGQPKSPQGREKVPSWLLRVRGRPQNRSTAYLPGGRALWALPPCKNAFDLACARGIVNMQSIGRFRYCPPEGRSVSLLCFQSTVESALLALCPLASSVAAALFSDSTMQLLRHGDANAIHGCKPHLGYNLMVTMTSERIIEQVSERVGVRKRPPLRGMSDVRMRC